MSQGALCQAVRDQLQKTFTLTSDSCEVGFDGQPKPSAGQFYTAIHPGSWTSLQNDYELGEEVSVLVTLTVKIGFAPKDRRGIAVWLASQDGANPAGLEPRLRQAICSIHQNELVRIAANTYIANAGQGPGGKFVTTLRLMRVDPPVLRDWKWFSAKAPEHPDEVSECGVSQQITFGRAQRVQDIPDMD